MKVTTSAGDVIELGPIETAPTIGIVDYSRRVTDDYGVTTVVERAFSRRMSVRLAVPFDGTGALQRRLAALRATPATWTADDRFASLSVRGFYKDFEVDHAVPPLSYCTLTVEGLAETAPIADAGGDPAVTGTSTLQLLQPVAITNDQLVSSSVPETDAAEWSGSTTYPLGARVIRAASHRVYESAIAGNVSDDPIAASGKWIDIGPTNRWAMFDQALGSLTSAANAITLTLTAPAIQAVALLDVTAATVRLQATGYDRTVAASAGATTFLDLPAGTTRVTVTIAGGSVSVGTLLVGKLVGLGVTEGSPTSGIADYSRKDVDDFGAVTIVERAWSKRMAAKSLITTASIDVVANRIAAVRAVPSLWIGLDGLDSLTVYGFFKEFSIEVGETTSKLSLSIEGLSAAGKIEPLGAQVNWPDIADPTGTKPADNADVTGEHTSKDTNAVSGRPASQVLTAVDKAKADIDGLVATFGTTASAAASANAARDAETNAKTARDAAQGARDAAQEARALAGGSASTAIAASDAAAQAKNDAQTASTASASARDAAAAARDLALGYRDAAQAGASNATSAATSAASARDAANQKASDAATSASSAGGSATTASGQATIATQKADAAGQSASIASAKADIATTKAGEASASSSRAATSETNAAGSANAASISQGVAATSAKASAFNANFPRTFAQKGALYSGTPAWGTTVPLPDSYFVAGSSGWVYQQKPVGSAFNYYIGLNRPVPLKDRLYRYQARFRTLDANTTYSTDFEWSNAADGAQGGSFGGFATLTPADGWRVIDYLVDARSGGFQAFAYAVPQMRGQVSAGATFEVDYFRFVDVTDTTAAAASASAAATSASNAATSQSAAGTSATAASTSATNASTSAGQASTFASNASTSANNAAGAANSATTQAGVAVSARDASVLTAAIMFPSVIDSVGSGYTGQATGALASTPLLASTALVNSGGRYGVNFGSGFAYTRQTVPATAGRVYEVEAEVEWTAVPTSGGIAFDITAIGLNSAYGAPSDVRKTTTPSLAIGIYRATARYGAVADAANGIIAWGAGAVYLRFGVNQYANTAGSVGRLLGITVRDITEKLQASASAAAAAGSASTASASQTAAGQSATAAQASAATASTKAGEASASSASAATSDSNALSSKNAAATSQSVSASSALQAAQTTAATMPSDFSQGDLFWMNGFAGNPDTQRPTNLGTGWSFPTVSGEGVVAQGVAGASIDISNRGLIAADTTRRYRATVRARKTSTSANSLFLQVFGITILADKVSSGNTPLVISTNISSSFADYTVEFGLEPVANLGPYIRLLARLYAPAGGFETGQISRIKLEDITSEVAARNSATASATSAASASTSKDAAGVSASAAKASETNAGTSAGTASVKAGEAATSSSNAQGFANSASTSQSLSASSATAAQLSAASTVPDNFTDPTQWLAERGTPVFTGGLMRGSTDTGNGVSVYSRGGQAIAAGRTYRLSVRHRLVSTSPGPTATWLGYEPRDGAGVVDLSATLATGYGWIVGGEATTVAQGWHVTTGTVTGDAILARYPNAASISPVALIAYGPGSVSVGEISSISIVDVTDVLAGQAAATAAVSSASSASTSQTAAGQSASAAKTSETNAGTSAGTASIKASEASTSAANALGSSNSASTSQLVAASSATQATQTVSSLMPSDFLQGYRFFKRSWALSSTATDFPVSSTALVNGDLQITGALGTLDVAHAGAFAVKPNRKYRLTVLWQIVDSGGLQSTAAILYYIPLDANGAYLGAGTPALNLTMTNGETGWGSGYKSSSFDIDASALLQQAAVTVRGLFRYQPNNAQQTIRIKSFSIEDVTESTTAQTAATASAGSASLASTKADAAGQSATSATAALNAAKTAQGSAEAARDQAAQSRTDAAGSASSASGSATLAAGSATTAGQKASAAATSEQNAAASSTAAGQQASASEASKTAAQTARGQAETFANQASTSKDSAAGSATTASTQAGLAAQSKTDAQNASSTATGAATAANNSASTASTKADAAGASAVAANQSRIDAQAANGNASANAGAAATSAAAASASASSANTTAMLASRFSQGALSRNAYFGTPGWVGDANTNDNAPPEWLIWFRPQGGYTGKSTYTSFYTGLPAVQIDRGGPNAGIVQPITLAKGWHVAEFDVYIEDGDWNGTGAHVNLTNGYTFNFHFVDQTDTADVRSGPMFAGNAPNGTRRQFGILFYNGAPSGADAKFHLMAGWEGFGVSYGNGTGFARTIWHKALIRPADQGEIDGRKARIDATTNAARIEQVNLTLTNIYGALAQRTSNVEARAGNIEARTGIVETAVANTTSKLAAARVEISAVSPGGRASMTVRSDNINGAAIDFGADVNFVGNLKIQKTAGGKTIMIDSDTGITFNNGVVMKVSGIGFGSNRQFLEWVGPSLASTAQCTEANAYQYIKTDGSGYFGGSLSAGQLKNGSASSGTGTQELAAVGPFGSNGGAVKYLASWAYRTEIKATYAASQTGLQQYRQAANTYNANADEFGVATFERAATTVTLARAFSGSALEQLDEHRYTTETATFVGNPPVIGDAPGSATITFTMGGGFTINDPQLVALDRTVRLGLNRGYTNSSGNVSQRLSIIAVEG